MEPEKREQFLLYGCVSRSIMKIAGLSDVDDFCCKYKKWFFAEYFGMPQYDKVKDIFADLGFSWVCDEPDYDKVLSHFLEGKSVMVLSHRDFRNPNLELNHATVLQQMDRQGFVLWTVTQKGSEGFLPKCNRSIWSACLCHANVVERKCP